MKLSFARFKVASRSTDWVEIIGDAFWLFILFALWLWQFETSDAQPLYHSILAGIGLISAIGLSIVAVLMLLHAFTSHWKR